MSSFKKILSFLAAFLLFSFSANQVSAEDADFVQPFNMGVYLGGNLNFHNPNFVNGFVVYDISQNPIIVSLQEFNKSASGLGLNAGLEINAPLGSVVTFSGRLGYNNLSGDFDGFYNSNTGSVVLDTNNVATRKNKVAYFEISPMFKFYNLLPAKPLYFLAGLELGIPVTNSFTETGTFKLTDRSTAQTASVDYVIPETEIVDAKTRVALALGLGYTFEIGKQVYLSPEVSYRIPFSTVSSNATYDTWKAPQLRFGVNLTFGFGGNDDVVDDNAHVHDAAFTINNVKTVTYDTKGNQVNVDKITLEEVQYTELFPLVPMVFFDQNQTTPSDKSTNLILSSSTGEFNVNTLDADAVAVNKSVMDIIGKRLQENSAANLTITGTNDGQSEKSNKNLSAQRAEYAKNYFVNNYGIDANRLKVNSQGLPSKPSSVKDKDGIDENRRVEFSSNIKDIVAPLMMEKDKQTFATPIAVEFVTDYTAEDSIETWEMNIEQSDKSLSMISGFGAPENISWTIKPNELKANDIPVDYTLTMKSKTGKVAKKVGTIPVEFFSYNRKKSEERPDKIISKFSLVVFDFDSPVISDNDKYILDKNVLPNIKSNSTVQIYGYSDRIGDAKYNQKLSLQRAQNVENYIKGKVKSANFETYGLGENIKVYDNDLTIGRQLSRTVQIYVITPKQ